MGAQNTSRSTLWFDSVEYTTSPSLPIDNASIMLLPPDHRMQFDSRWMMESYQMTTVGNMTNKNESTFTMDFIGNSLSWYGYIQHNTSTVAATASYTIDEEIPTIFGINASSVPSHHFDIQLLFFQKPIFNNGPHRLTVTYNGDVEHHSTPLTLQYIIVQNGTAGLPPPAENFTAAFSSTTSDIATFPPALSKANVQTGPIVGGVIGGLTLIVVVFLIFFFLSWRRRAAAASEVYSIDESFHEAPPPLNPFIMTEDDVVGEKQRTPQPSTNIASSVPAAVDDAHQTKQTRIRYAHNPSESNRDEAISNRLGITETPSVQSVSTSSSRRSLTPTYDTGNDFFAS